MGGEGEGRRGKNGKGREREEGRGCPKSQNRADALGYTGAVHIVKRMRTRCYYIDRPFTTRRQCYVCQHCSLKAVAQLGLGQFTVLHALHATRSSHEIAIGATTVWTGGDLSLQLLGWEASNVLVPPTSWP